MRPLSARTKKLIGAIIMLVWLVIYAFLATGVGIRVLPNAPWYVEFFYYAVAGALWIVPIGLLLPWMYREPTAKP